VRAVAALRRVAGSSATTSAPASARPAVSNTAPARRAPATSTSGGGSASSPSVTQKGADSALFLAEALKRVKAAGYAVVNVDSTLILAAPKIGPHAAAIRSHLAGLLGIPPGCVGVKAKTPEGMGTDNAAIAHAVVLLEKKAAKSGAGKVRKQH